MARKIEWTIEGRESKLEILKYWNNRNQSNSYSKKLNKLFTDSLKAIVKYPQIGKTTEEPDIKYITVRAYHIFYRELPGSILILLIWDSRRDPDSLINIR
jgi:toxin YoeB